MNSDDGLANAPPIYAPGEFYRLRCEGLLWVVSSHSRPTAIDPKQTSLDRIGYGALESQHWKSGAHMDKQAKNILFKTYWGSNGWLPAPKTDPQDFAYAKAQGLMFEPASIGHDQCLDEVLDMIKRIPPAKAARAFVASLSRRRLDWRSGVASYHLACQMVPHQYTPTVCGHSYLPDGTVTTTSYTCAVCRDVVPGLTVGEDQYTDVDLNVLNFERIKWGGVRHGQLIYTWFDLQELLRDDIPNPTEEDLAILRAILGIIDLSKPSDHAGSLEKRLADVVKSSKNERRVIIDVLAHLGVLKPASFERPIHSRSDWSEAAACWRGEDKFDHEAVCKHFGRWLQTEVNH